MKRKAVVKKKRKQLPQIRITERAAVQRINRAFRRIDGPPARQVKKSRTAKAIFDLGDYYVVDFERGGIDQDHVHLEELARELKVLPDWEYVYEQGDK